MNEKRKTIILKEIYFWKQNNMLPEQYCNYLIALYSEGEEKYLAKLNDKKKWYADIEILFSMLFLTMIIIAMIITYHTYFSFGMQTLFFIISCIMIFFCMKYYRKKHFNPLIIYITSALIVLSYTIQMYENFFRDKPIILFLALLLNSIAWIIFGFRKNHLFFKIIGVSALTILSVMSLKNFF